MSKLPANLGRKGFTESQEGFENQQQLEEHNNYQIYQPLVILSQNIFKIAKKVIYKRPFCIYGTKNCYQSYPEMNGLVSVNRKTSFRKHGSPNNNKPDIHNQIESFAQNTNNVSQKTKLVIVPLNSLCVQQNNSNMFNSLQNSKILTKSKLNYADMSQSKGSIGQSLRNSNINASQEFVQQKTLQFTKFSEIFPKRFALIYNKFQQILAGKYDMTIVFRNVKAITSNGMAKTFDTQIPINSQSHQDILDYRKNTSSPSIKHDKGYLNKKIKQKVLEKKGELQFISEFQCGNLHCAFRDRKIQDLIYLFIGNDTNTHGYNQWFYFGVKSPVKRTCRFALINISKDFSFIKGMRLFHFNRKKGWRNDVNYLQYRNKYIKKNGKNYDTVDFQFSFSDEDLNDYQFFCLSFPYSYTRMMNFTKQIEKRHVNKVSIFVSQICQSQCNNCIPCIKLSINTDSPSKQKNKQKKDCIIVMARQHPSQAVGSFICEKIIQILTNNSALATNILHSYTWYFIQMANPDGVIHGHSRTTLKGYDANRCWDKNSLHLSQQVYGINKFIEQINSKEKINCIIDLHGHSKQSGSFCYFSQRNQFSKLFSYYLCEDNTPQMTNYFNASKFKFGVSYQKRPTFRGQMYHRIGIKNSVTIQTSLFGYIKAGQFINYSEADFTNIAHSLLQAFQKVIKSNKISSNDKKTLLLKINQAFPNNKKRKGSDSQNDSDFSDSDPEGDYLKQEERINLIEKPTQQINTDKQKPSQSNTEQVKQKRTSFIVNKKSVLYGQFGFSRTFSQSRQKSKILKGSQKLKNDAIHNFSAINTNNRNVSSQNSRQKHQSKQEKKRRRPIYTNAFVDMSQMRPIAQHQSEQLTKRYSLTNLQKQLSFRRTIRRGILGLNQNSLKSTYSQQTSQKKPRRCHSQSQRRMKRSIQYEKVQQPIVVYPTDTNVRFQVSNVDVAAEANAFIDFMRNKSAHSSIKGQKQTLLHQRTMYGYCFNPKSIKERVRKTRKQNNLSSSIKRSDFNQTCLIIGRRAK